MEVVCEADGDYRAETVYGVTASDFKEEIIVTYDQYKTIMTALEANKQASERIQERRPLSPTAIHREREADAAISALRAAFYENARVLVVQP